MYSAIYVVLLAISGLCTGFKVDHPGFAKDEVKPLGVELLKASAPIDGGLDDGVNPLKAPAPVGGGFDDGFEPKKTPNSAAGFEEFDLGIETATARNVEARLLSAEHEALDKMAAQKGWILASYADGTPIPGLAEKRHVHNQALIINGRNAYNGYQPFMVSFQYISGQYAYHICGGSLWNTNRVVTAAHCLDYFKQGWEHKAALGYYQLSLGTSNPGSQLIRVTAVYNPKEYDIGGLGYPGDIAVVYLEHHAQITPTVQTTMLSSFLPYEIANQRATLTGWGKLSGGKDGVGADILQYVELTVLDKETCVGYWRANIQDEHVCVIGENAGSCQGDSGSPLMYARQQVGVVSWGEEECSVKYPAVYNSPAAHMTWLGTHYY